MVFSVAYPPPVTIWPHTADRLHSHRLLPSNTEDVGNSIAIIHLLQ